jgi:hypothetical protein
MTNQQPVCCLCGELCEPWPTPGGGRIYGYGNNPDPLGTNDDDRCCALCNDTKVIPARLGMIVATTSPPTTDNRSNES